LIKAPAARSIHGMAQQFKIERRACLLSALALACDPICYAETTSPLEGMWMATLGPEDNRARVGLEFMRAPGGSLQSFFTIDQLNFFRVPLPALEVAGAGHWRIKQYEVELTLWEDRLLVSGLIDDPVEMRRTAALPQRPPAAPAVPKPEFGWRLGLGGPVYAPVALYGDMAYVGNADGVMYAVDTRGGNVAWSFTAGRPIHGEATVTADAVFFASDNGRLYRLNRASGKEIWRYELDDGRTERVLPNPFVFDYDHIAPQPVLADGVLYVGSADGCVHAVDATRSERIWRFQSEGKVRSSVALHRDTVVFGTVGKRIHQLDRATGRERWRSETSGAVTSTPVFAGEHFIVGDRGSHLTAWIPGRKEPIWRQPYWGSWIESSAVIDAGTGYIGSGDLFVVSAFDPTNGRNLWRTHVGGWVVQRPAVTERCVYAAVSGARRRPKHFIEQAAGLTALDRRSGRIVWHWPAPVTPGAFWFGMSAAPVVVGGQILCGALDGSLYSFPHVDTVHA
jgi:outer membrane protein assembly factor BamB